MAESQVTIQVGVTGAEALNRLKEQMAAVDAAATKAQGSMPAVAKAVGDMGAAASSAQSPVNGLVGALDGMMGKLVGLAAQLGLTVGAIALFKSSLDAAFAREAAENRLQALSSSTHEYELALTAAEIASRRFGVTQTQAANALGDTWGRLKAVGLTLGDVNQIYTGFNVIAREARVGTEDAAGAFLQLSQAMGSGKLQGDELAIVLERFPQLAQAIADKMGVSASSIKQLGSEGKIGLKAIRDALADAAERADQLGGTFTNQQVTLAQVAQRWEEVQVAIGKAMAPVYLEMINAFGDAVFLLATYLTGAKDAWKANEAGIKTLVSIVGEAAKISAAIFIVIKAYQAWQAAVKAVVAVKAALLAMTGPKGWALIAAGAAAAAGAYMALNAATKAAGDEITRLKNESEEAFQKRKKQAEAELKAQQTVTEATQTAAEAAKELKKAQKEVTESIKEAAAAADALAQKQTSAIDQQLSLTNARVTAEKAVNDVLLQQAERQLKAAQTQEHRIAAARQIYALTVRNADLELRATLAAIDAEVRKAQIVKQTAQVRLKEVESIVSLAQAQGVATAEHFKALAAQKEALGIATRNYDVAVKLAGEQRKTAQAIYQGKVEAAQAAYETNVMAQNTQTAASAAGKFANELERGAAAAGKAADAMSEAKNSATGLGGTFGEAGKNPIFMEAYYQARKNMKGTGSIYSLLRESNAINDRFSKIAEQFNQSKALERNSNALEELEAALGPLAKQLAMSTGIKIKDNKQYDLTPYADGGYVTGPTPALVGEAGAEYVIPANRMDQAMQAYSAGARGTAVLDPSVNVTTGPVMQMGGSDYVSRSDMTSAVQSAVRQASNLTLERIQSDPRLRRSIGIS